MDHDIAEGVYVQLLTRDGAPTGYAFQQFHVGQVRTYQGVEYLHAGFQYSGASLDLGFPNAEAVLAFHANVLGLNIWKQAADDLWVAKVRTVWLDPVTGEETGISMEDTYAVTGYVHDLNQVTLTLGSPLDAIGGDWPRRVLTQAMVGALPPNGDVRF
jgi:hypothetical protein